MIVGTPTRLNLIPSGVMPVVYLNQMDMGYDKQFLIYNGDQPYNAPEGISVTIRGKKGDLNGITENVTYTVGSNLMTVHVTQQMTAVAGDSNIFELVIVDTEGLRVGTINMVFAVEPDALGDAVISESEIGYAENVLTELQSVQAVNNQVQQNKENIAKEVQDRISSVSNETQNRIAAVNAEMSARQEADTTLQNNINAEANRAKAAENTLQQSINSEASARAAAVNAEASARATADANLQSQISQIVAPSGAAPSAAEVQNARIGADNVTYSTLGEAIRTQVTGLKSALNGIGEAENISYLSLKNDKMQLDNTLSIISNGLLSVTDYVEIPTDAISITVSTKTKSASGDVYILPQVFFFNASKTYLSRQSGQSADTATFEIPRNAAYVRVNQPSSTVSSSVKRLVKFNRQSYRNRDTLTSSDDLNNVTQPGVYYYNQPEIPAHAPFQTGYIRVLVIKSANADNHVGAWQICVGGDALKFRGKTQDSKYDNWHTVQLSSNDLTEAINSGLYTRATLTSADDCNTLTKPGQYYYNSSSVPVHAPFQTGHNRILVVKSGSDDMYVGSWQICCQSNTLKFRGRVVGDTYDDWHTVQLSSEELAESIRSGLYYRGDLTASDDMDAIAKTGVYWYQTGATPKNAPANLSARPLIIKSRTDETLSQMAQIVVADGVLYFRDKRSADVAMSNWHSVGLGSPIYQTETLPYNAVLYHQKWDDLLTTYGRVLRRIDLGKVDDDASLPMYAYEFSPQRDMVGISADGSTSKVMSFDWTNALYKRPKILIIGGVHGNEKCTPMDIYAIVKELLTRDHNDIACKFDWYFIPLVNPWGYSHARLDSDGNILYDNTGTTASVVECTESINAGIRNNGHDMNINRDWSDVIYTMGGEQYGFQTPELQLIKDYVIGIKPDFFIDAHQNHANPSVSTNPVCCHAGAPVDENILDSNYQDTMKKIYRYIDIANADTDKTMLRYASYPTNSFQACRIWPTIKGATSEHYFGGVTVQRGSATIGNTEHQDVKTPYSVCTETSEICATYAGTEKWYNPIACTFSTTYLWNVIKQIAKLF